MKYAEIVLTFDDETIAKRTLQSISPDNTPLPEGLQIKTNLDNNQIRLQIECNRGLDSFRATREDLMSAISLSLKTGKTIE